MGDHCLKLAVEPPQGKPQGNKSRRPLEVIGAFALRLAGFNLFEERLTCGGGPDVRQCPLLEARFHDTLRRCQVLLSGPQCHRGRVDLLRGLIKRPPGWVWPHDAGLQQLPRGQITRQLAFECRQMVLCGLQPRLGGVHLVLLRGLGGLWTILWGDGRPRRCAASSLRNRWTSLRLPRPRRARIFALVTSRPSASRASIALITSSRVMTSPFS